MAIQQVFKNFNPNKSVFTKSSYREAIGDADNNGYAVIKITPEYARLGFDKPNSPIIGVLRTDSEQYAVSFGIEANWTTLGDVGSTILPGIAGAISGPAKKLSGVGNLLGAADFAESITSKLIYQHSGRIGINPQMRVVDWNGTGQPVYTALLLASYCLPEKRAELGKKGVKYISSKGKEVSPKLDAIKQKQTDLVVDIFNTSKTKIQEGVAAVKTAVDAVENKVLGTGYVNRTLEAVIEDLNDLSTLRSSPVPVTIEIGKYFKKSDMVIKSVNFNFSKEVTVEGPLFVDIELTLESRKILTDVDDVGFYPASGGDRAYIMRKGVNATGFDMGE